MTSDSKTSITPDDATTESEQTTTQADGATATTDAPQAETAADAPETDADASADTAGQAPVAAQASDGKRSNSGVAAGAVAIVSAGLGLVSLTGSSLGEMLRTRQEIVGQIEMQSGGGGDQVEVAYGAPWDTIAMVNGAFALLALLVGGGLLAVQATNADSKGWIKAVALGGALLGVIGLGIAGGMYLDLFGADPVLPQAPAMPGAGG
ncbi:MAG: hypothetical protein GEU97_06655 [Actinophytocola sp.]|nr:hypothetical protein [Actinophytocola sp.]